MIEKAPKHIKEEDTIKAKEVFAEESAKNPNFKKVFDSWLAFRHNEAQWFSLAEKSYTDFMTTNPWKPGA